MPSPPVVGVVIPLGPNAHHARWLDSCLISVARQSRPANFIVIVDDMHGLDEPPDLSLMVGGGDLPEVHIYRPPWRLGVPHAFNAGNAKAFELGADLALMLGADDTLESRVIDSLVKTYERRDRREGYYWCEVLYSNGVEQALPCNCAAVTPEFWRETGGFPVESAHGACDAAFISMMLIHNPRALMQVPGQPAARFMHRLHDQQATRDGAPCIDVVRDWLTRRYEPTQWGRYN